MYYVYILESLKNRRLYIGSSGDAEARHKMHNEGKVKATKYMRPYRLVHKESFGSASEARKREYYLKSLKSSKYIREKIIKGG